MTKGAVATKLPKIDTWALQDYGRLFIVYRFSTLRPFWDLVVLTAGNEEQKKSFQEQIEIKTKRKEIPTSVRCVLVVNQQFDRYTCSSNQFVHIFYLRLQVIYKLMTFLARYNSYLHIESFLLEPLRGNYLLLEPRT